MKPLLHPRTKQQLDRFIASPKNGLILQGESGAGKSYVAQWLAEQVLERSIESDPYVFVINGSDSGIDEVRALQKKLSLHVPGSGVIRRVVIFEHFDKFRHEAQNALLKTLEEPPLDTLLIPTISDKQAVLSTIHSRLPQLLVRPVSYDEAMAYSSDKTKAERAYHLSGGAAGLFIALLADDTAHPLTKGVVRAKELLAQEKYMRLASIDALLKDKDNDYKLVLDGMARLLSASYAGARAAKKSSTVLRQHQRRLDTMMQALHDLNSGVHQKLVLTRLFLAL